MNADVLREIQTLHDAPIAEIRARYRDVFQEEPRTKHRQPLLRRLAWRLQSLAEGGLSERARQRAFEIANDADLRVLAPRGLKLSLQTEQPPARLDHRIPRPGSKLTRDYQGNTVAVKVLCDGFEFQGRRYRSLSAIATEVTGTRWNGLAFFGLTRKRMTKARHGNAKY